MNEKEELYSRIEVLRAELNKSIDMADIDLTNNDVLEKSQKIEILLAEYQKKCMD